MTNLETWRSVPGYEGYYEVSDLGRVRSLDRIVPSRPGRTRFAKGKLVGDALSSAQNVTQYRVVTLHRSGRRPIQRKVHVLVLEAHVGPRPTGCFGCHSNGDALDNRLENLRWDTPAGNVQDAIQHGAHWQATKAACLRNHLLEAPNLEVYSLAKGWRQCLACSRARNRVRRTQHGGYLTNLDQWADEYYEQIMSAR